MKKLVQLLLVVVLVMSGYVGSALAAGRGDSHGVIGKKVKDHQGRVIGTVKNIVLTDEGCVQYVILSGEGRRLRDKLYPVPWTVFSANDRRDYYTVRINEDVLREAPSFTTSSWPDFSAPTWSTNVTNFYQTRINVHQNAPDTAIDVKGKSDTSTSKKLKNDRRTTDTDMKAGAADESSSKKESATSPSKKSDSSDSRKNKDKGDKVRDQEKARDTDRKSKSDHDRSNGKALNTDSSSKSSVEAPTSTMDKSKSSVDSGMMPPRDKSDMRDSGSMRNSMDAGRSGAERPSMGGPSMGGGPAGPSEKPESSRDTR